ncbi:MAG: hypothetical protein HN337_05530 [Deltaproteobacteria bacterium]|jgi:orotate phosphoribosyltransferase|nr:hypothetical protein [Deltaproteobacteria bacterium]
MPEFDREKFNRFVIQNRVVGFFDKEVTLKSGRKSHWYVNWRTVGADAYLLDELTDYLIEFTKSLGVEVDAFYGVPEGATKLGVLATYKWVKSRSDFAPGKYSIPMGRAKPKEHGVPKDRFFVGAPEGRIAVVEDVTTTGGSLLSELDRLREAEVNVVAAIGLTNRMEQTDDGRSVEETVQSKGVPYYSLSEATSFLPEAYRALKPTEEVARSIESEFEEYGVQPIKLIS